MKSIFRSLLTALAITLSASAAQAANKTLTMMIVPQFTAVKINATWKPLLDKVTEKTGIAINLIYEQDIPAFEEAFDKGKPDLIYCNPYHAVMANEGQDYEPIVRRKKPLKGILIAPADTTLTADNLSQLNGAKLLFPAPNAFGASLYMRALLVREHKLTFDTIYVKTHPNVIRGIIRGQGQAGGMVGATLAAEGDEIKSKVKVVYETPAAPSHPIAVHPRVSKADREALQKAFLEVLNANPDMADAVQLGEAIPTSFESEYVALKKLGLKDFLQ